MNGRNTVKAISAWTFAMVRYTAGIGSWNADKLKAKSKKTRKLMTMNGALYPQADVYRLHATCRAGGRD